MPDPAFVAETIFDLIFEWNPWLDAYKPYLPTDPTARILDFGCGDGALLTSLASLGFRNLVGVEPDRLRREACQRNGQTVSRRADEDGPDFDLVILRHVLPHLHDPLYVLSMLRQKLRPGGRLLVETFNAALPTAFYTLANDETHIRAYTERSLRLLLVSAGFSRVRIEPADPPTRLAYALARRLYVQTLKLRFLLERGNGNNPTLWSKNILAIAEE